MDILLTIAIPTYNRAEYLDECLSSICRQATSNDPRLEVLISNNNSNDSTDDVVAKYHSSLGATLTYLKNDTNIGPDGNFLQCFRKAKGKYFLILGDDDLLLDGAGDIILRFLENGNYGVVYLNSYGFIHDSQREKPDRGLSGSTIYDDIAKFVRKISYFVTFTSVNIVNRTMVNQERDWQPFLKSNLVQLGWVFDALFKATQNAFIADYCIAARLYNSGGYRLSKVFGENFDQICRMFMASGIEEQYFEIIKNSLLTRHFPAQIIRQRNNMTHLEQENYFHTFYRLYRRYPRFWLFTVPAIFLPRKVVYFFYTLVKWIKTND
jgi:glycosyltransferase involved in cell wall biosynthesis